MKKYLPILKKTPLFYGIDEKGIEELLESLSAFVKTYEKDEIIFQENDKIDHLSIVLKGMVKILKHDYFGNINIITTLTTSDTFAEVFVFAGLNKTEVTAVTMEKSEILFLDYKNIITSSNTSSFQHKILENIIKNLAEKNLVLKQKIEFISKRDIKSKILSYLSYMASQKSNDTFKIPFDRQGLADFLCVDRSALSRVLSELKKDGIIDYKKNIFKIRKNL